MQSSNPIVGTDMTSVFQPVQNGQPVNPATVAAKLTQGVGQNAETDVSGAIQHLGPGSYRLTYTATKPGKHLIVWETTGPAIVAFDTELVSGRPDA